jgi:hypothetical protein
MIVDCAQAHLITKNQRILAACAEEMAHRAPTAQALRTAALKSISAVSALETARHVSTAPVNRSVQQLLMRAVCAAETAHPALIVTA